jgi:ABC-2 type transport system permease protein
MQCAYMPVNIARPGENPKFEPMPWFYAPLLQTSPYHPITKNGTVVKANFASLLDFPKGDTAALHKEILLVSGNATHISASPNNLDMNVMMTINPEEYFTRAHAPVAAVLEGRFPSIFKNRMMPKGMTSAKAKRDESEDTRMIVVADGDIVRNDLEYSAGRTMIVPLGFDRVSRMTYGNKDFALNSMLYLTDDSGIMELRNRTVRLRLLNKAVVMEKAEEIRAVNVLLPLLIVALFGTAYIMTRRRRWVKG